MGCCVLSTQIKGSVTHLCQYNTMLKGFKKIHLSFNMFSQRSADVFLNLYYCGNLYSVVVLAFLKY